MFLQLRSCGSGNINRSPHRTKTAFGRFEMSDLVLECDNCDRSGFHLSVSDRNIRDSRLICKCIPDSKSSSFPKLQRNRVLINYWSGFKLGLNSQLFRPMTCKLFRIQHFSSPEHTDPKQTTFSNGNMREIKSSPDIVEFWKSIINENGYSLSKAVAKSKKFFKRYFMFSLFVHIPVVWRIDHAFSKESILYFTNSYSTCGIGPKIPM